MIHPLLPNSSTTSSIPCFSFPVHLYSVQYSYLPCNSITYVHILLLCKLYTILPQLQPAINSICQETQFSKDVNGFTLRKHTHLHTASCLQGVSDPISNSNIPRPTLLPNTHSSLCIVIQSSSASLPSLPPTHPQFLWGGQYARPPVQM